MGRHGFFACQLPQAKKWIRLRQLLLLLSRLAAAALLIAMLCGWTGGGQLLSVLGGQTTHHVFVLDDSYSMGDQSGSTGSGPSTAYKRSLLALEKLTRRLASDDGNHQLTVMRASRAALSIGGGNDSGDAVADLSAQTVTSDAQLVSRVMATEASAVRTDLVPALELSTKLMNSNPADTKYFYVASDFRQRDWGSAERLSDAMKGLVGDNVEVRMIDCATSPASNLAITDLSPVQDVWVAGVPVEIAVTVRNFGQASVRNVSLASRVILYPDELQTVDPTLQFSGKTESLPAIVIESLAPGAELTKKFQVFIAEAGTHAVEVSLPDDALKIDNVRSCTLPLSATEKVLLIDGDTDGRGTYHIASALNPGSQVRLGAIPEIKPLSFLRSATVDTLLQYRAVYLSNIPEVTDNVANALSQYVTRGGGLAWFLGDGVRRDSYNSVLLKENRFLLPGTLTAPSELIPPVSGEAGDVLIGEEGTFLDRLRGGGDGIWSSIGVSQSWEFADLESNDAAESESESGVNEVVRPPRVRVALKRRDEAPFVTEHEVGEGKVVTVLTGINGRWTNITSAPTFVPFLLLTNASLWSGAAPPTIRMIDEPLVKSLPSDQYLPELTYVPATTDPPRVPIEMTAEVAKPDSRGGEIDAGVTTVDLNPNEMIVLGDSNVDEILRPGISEWSLTRSDGRGQVIPIASALRLGESDLKRSNTAEIQQALMPLEVQFVSSSVWNETNRAAGSSALTLFLLGLLSLVLAAEQALAYWASYHVSPSPTGKSF